MTRGSRALIACATVLVVLAAFVILLRDDGGEGAISTAGGRIPADAEARETTLVQPRDEARTHATTEQVAEGEQYGTALVTAESADGALQFRGRVEDVATKEPVPDALVVCERTEAMATTDSAGRFAAEPPLAAGDGVRVFDPRHDTHIRSVPYDELLLDPSGELIVRIAIGPTTRFLLPLGATGVAADWEARLVFVDPGRGRAEQSWQPGRGLGLEQSSPGWIRYDNPMFSAEEPPFAGTILLEARNLDGTLIARGETSSAIGISPDVVLLEVVQRLGTVRGRIQGLDGYGVDDVRIHAVPVGAGVLAEGGSLREHALETKTDGLGRFELKALAVGPWRLHAIHLHHQVSLTERIQVEAGVTELAPMTLVLPSVAGEISGTLVMTKGDLPPYLFVELTALDGSRRSIDTAGGARGFGGLSGFNYQDDQDGAFPAYSFNFQDLPKARYALAVLDPSGARWSPPEAVVEPPLEGLVFTRLPDEDWRTLKLEAFDATSGVELDAVEVRIERGGRELDTRRMASGSDGLRVTLAGDLRLYVSAKGYETTQLGAADITLDGDVLHARAELRPGWSGRLEFLDCEGRLEVLDARGPSLWLARRAHPPVPGVLVFVDGRQVATSGPDGIAELKVEGPPDAITFRAPGHHVLGSRLIERDGWMSAERFGVVWMLSE